MQEGKMKNPVNELTKRQLATLERRKHIVETAALCFIEQGFHQTSIRDIAKHAGISLGNLYNHFASKTDLIAEIASLEAEELITIRSILGDDGSALKIIDAFVVAYFEYVSCPENAVLAAEITAEAMRSPQIVAGFSDNRNTITAALKTVLGSTSISIPETLDEMALVLLDLVESAASRVAFETENIKAATLTGLRSIVQRVLVAPTSD